MRRRKGNWKSKNRIEQSEKEWKNGNGTAENDNSGKL